MNEIRKVGTRKDPQVYVKFGDILEDCDTGDPRDIYIVAQRTPTSGMLICLSSGERYSSGRISMPEYGGRQQIDLRTLNTLYGSNFYPVSQTIQIDPEVR